MSEERPLFILAGNGPYENRGCEAIVRGTVKILREYFRDPRFVCLSHFNSREQYLKQRLQETDDAIVHLTSHTINKNTAIKKFWNPNTWLYVYRHFYNPGALKSKIYCDMLPHLDDAAAILSIGGDNYSIDYGKKPTLFTSLDDFVLAHGRPLVIWGASIGPFSSMPEYECYMSEHLEKVTGIFARESATIEYLKSIGVRENVHPVADPAFIMEPIKPAEIEDKVPIEKGSIGMNLSPLMARYVTGGDLKKWTSMAASIIGDVAEKTGMHIYLIPHVTRPGSSDHNFMQRALSLIPEKNKNITLVPREYNAEETKWIIGRMDLFAGARTHSTIAALSSGIPTLSFAYSIKARGINRDIFGHTNYCLEPKELDASAISCKIASMLDDSATIGKDLAVQIPRTQRAALSAGIRLKQIISGGTI